MVEQVKIEQMKFFLRFTDTPNEDMKRGTSIHAADDGNDQTLNGLCGYALESDNIDDAIEEIENGVWQFAFVGKATLFEGKYAKDVNLVPDGDLFIPIKFICEVEYTND